MSDFLYVFIRFGGVPWIKGETRFMERSLGFWSPSAPHSIKIGIAINRDGGPVRVSPCSLAGPCVARVWSIRSRNSFFSARDG